jgi:hypothetical protein
MRTRKSRELVHEGDYLAEIDVELIVTDDDWSPYLSHEDALRLDAVRRALLRGDPIGAAKLARIYRLVPVTAA